MAGTRMKTSRVAATIVLALLLAALSFSLVFRVPLMLWLSSKVRKPQPLIVRHHVAIPCANRYSLAQRTVIRSDLDSRRAPGSSPPPAALECSLDGTAYRPFPTVSYSTFSNTMGIREITVGGSAVWIRITTTNQADLGRPVTLIFKGEVR